MSNLTLNKKDEYFLSIAKLGIHSFMMLGVVTNGEPRLLARVGKSADIDSCFPSIPGLMIKLIITPALASLVDEKVIKKKRLANINYQAYAINYEQVKEYLGMIAEIEKKQFQNPEIVAGIKRVYGDNAIEDEAIKCHVPIEENGDIVKFNLKKLKECEFLTTEEIKAKTSSEIIAGVQQIHLNNTCRTSAKNIVEAILGFVTDVSDYFFISPKHQTKLIKGQPEKESFYILPPPPNCANVSKEQEAVLKKIYKRLEEIPKLNPESPESRKKFDALKFMYKDIAGENKLSAKALLGKILEHEDSNQNSLFQKRSPNFLSRLFSLSSSTKRMFDDMENGLKKMMTSQEVNDVIEKFKIQKGNPTEENPETEVRLSKPS
jgi:hypothetical protein